MHGSVYSYDKLTGALVVDISSKSGSGTYSSWDINLDGAVGAIGYTGSQGYTGSIGYTGSAGAGYTGSQGAPGSGGAIANYGSFYDSSDQVALAENTAYAIPLGTTAEAIGTSIVDGTKIKVDYEGVYNIQFSLQLHNRGGAGSGTVVQIWLRRNGIDVVDSATKIDVDTNSPWQVPAWNFMLSLNANDYVELIWSTNNVSIAIEANTATSPAPAIPSTILTIQQVMYTQQGYTGSQGNIGYTGSLGYTGSIGYTGSQGVGYTGSAGAGYTGSKGDTGYTGSQGVIGYTGSVSTIAAAGSLTGSTLNSTVTASSLTSVGQLDNLQIAGGASVTSNSATTHYLNFGTIGQLFDDGNFQIGRAHV